MSGEGYIRYEIDRLRMVLLALERECTGSVIVGAAAEELRDVAKRLTDLTRADKGHLPTPAAKPMEIARAA